MAEAVDNYWKALWESRPAEQTTKAWRKHNRAVHLAKTGHFWNMLCSVISNPSLMWKLAK